MLSETDISKMAGDIRRRMIEEFKEKHASLRTRAFRVPVDEARRIAELLHCPLQIATCAYIVEMDGILSAKSAADLMMLEFRRRASVGEEVPNLPGSLLDFAIEESKWIEYIYGGFARAIERHTRSLSNLEGALNTEEATVEQALAVIRERRRIAEGAIAPIVEEWQKDHIRSHGLDALTAFGPVLTKWPRMTFLGKLNIIRRRTQALFRLLAKILAQASDSATVDASILRLNRLLDILALDYKKMDSTAIAHLLLQMAPRASGRGDKVAYVIVGSPSTRGNKAEPDMTSPLDFLERDIHLARRRGDEERERYLSERIARVIRVLEYKGMDVKQSTEEILREIAQRFGLNVEVATRYGEDLMDQLEIVPPDERENKAAHLIFDFIVDRIYGR